MSPMKPQQTVEHPDRLTTDHRPAEARSNHLASGWVEHDMDIARVAGTTTTTPLAGGGFIDDIAVQRCVAGTLDRGAGMSRAERELAVVQLYRRGYTNPEIVHRTGVSIRTIGSILRRAGSVPTGVARPVPAVPDGCTPDLARRARLVVAARAPDAVVAGELLHALGLIALSTSPTPGTAVTQGRDRPRPTSERID